MDLELASSDDTPPNLDLRAARLRAEKAVLQEALTRSNHTLSVAARLLGISRPTLYGLMESHGLMLEATRTADAAETAPAADAAKANPAADGSNLTTLQNDIG
jgi:two-component system NtrC family response regulator